MRFKLIAVNRLKDYSMTRPRNEQISAQDTPYYHVVSRCVRRTYLCGQDHLSGKDYEHRRQWIENRIRLLSSLFAIDICAYAVMSNHIHLVVKLCPGQVDDLSNEEIAHRWTCLFKGPALVQKWINGDTLCPAERQTVGDCIAVFKDRLASLSWFMKCLNEPIARQANKEDGCTGHFWEGRYRSQALLSEEALLSCMAYVDLNPVRADMAKTPEASEYTSVKERIRPAFDLSEAVKEQIELQSLLKFDLPLKPLAVFEGAAIGDEQDGIMFSLEDYLTLVDYTGRVIRDDKRGAIPQHLPPILQRLHIDQKTWLDNATRFERNFYRRFSRRCQRVRKAA